MPLQVKRPGGDGVDDLKAQVDRLQQLVDFLAGNVSDPSKNGNSRPQSSSAELLNPITPPALTDATTPTTSCFPSQSARSSRSAQGAETVSMSTHELHEEYDIKQNDLCEALAHLALQNAVHLDEPRTVSIRVYRRHLMRSNAYSPRLLY